MKTPLVLVLSVALVSVGFTIFGCTHQQVLSPIARAFGVPPESELAACRLAYARLQGGLLRSRLLVEPVMLAPGGHRQWRGDLAQSIARTASLRTHTRFDATSTPPEVSFPEKMYHNQLRYLWDRSRDYERCVKSSPPSLDYVCFVEIFVGRQENGAPEKVAAIQVYVFEKQGQLAYTRLYNSAHFGPGLSLEGEAAVEFVAGSLADILHMAPEQAFPPYGVG